MRISAASRGAGAERASSQVFTGARDIAAQMRRAIRRARAVEQPWLHWCIAAMFPPGVLRDLAALPLRPRAGQGASGRREYCNDERIYFDAANMARFPVMRCVAEALQSPHVAGAVHDAFSAPADRTYLRIEYALDTDGFWLEPHTDLGVKKFTCFIYIEGAGDLGTDIYADAQTLAYRVPFAPNSALAFVPGAETWHGFVPRRIAGLRRSLIVNYVGAEWRAREQLSFPDEPVRLRALTGLHPPT
jgi:hypothetical protein